MFTLQCIYNSQLVIELVYVVKPLQNVHEITSFIHIIIFQIHKTNLMYMKK